MEKHKFDNIYDMLTKGRAGFGITYQELEEAVARAEELEAKSGIGFEIDDSSISFKAKDLNIQLNVSIYDICENEAVFSPWAVEAIGYIEDIILSGKDVEQHLNHWEMYDGMDDDCRYDVHYAYWKLENARTKTAAEA